jgi:hypothetical protein
MRSTSPLFSPMTWRRLSNWRKCGDKSLLLRLVVQPVEIRGGAFTPGLYLKDGWVITSRGCCNSCWFCVVPKREGKIRELPITYGHILQDNNILACSRSHIIKVFKMLEQGKRKYKKPVELKGGLEAKLMQPWIAEELAKLKPSQLFFAYDTPDDLEPLVQAGKMLFNAGWRKGSHALRCYVLCGFKGDTLEKAEKRMIETIGAGFMPMAMLYRDQKGERDRQWMKWQRLWARPAIINDAMRNAA